MINTDGRKRVVIEGITPIIDNGAFPIKRVVGEEVTVAADVFADGHDELQAALMYKPVSERTWSETLMRKKENDRWMASFSIEEMVTYSFMVCGWIDAFSTWRKALLIKKEAGQDVDIELKAGGSMMRKTASRADSGCRKRLLYLAEIVENDHDPENAVAVATGDELVNLMGMFPDRTFESRSAVYRVDVERVRALYSSWYELFPRSCTNDPARHGTFKECAKRLGDIANMGFHIVYLPPIHPIGRQNRKGKNNTVIAQPGDPGSPWAIGSAEGGHKSVNSELGTMEDFTSLVEKAAELGIEIALDIAFQCAPDHPYIAEHPEWFRKRHDGSIQYAENPPKKYEDIVPFDFECDNWKTLWNELKSIIDFWIDKGIRIFRVDNPHTKAFLFWEWLIKEVKESHSDVLFLAEAFTRPRLMQRLAKTGFSQSYTYFTWRNTRWELSHYLGELTETGLRDYFRPNFWPNTPDILPEFIQYGGRPAFVLRLLLAGTLCSNYGIYGPAYELCVKEALPDKEEYADSEKYEIKNWNWNSADSLRKLITRLNRIREENPALQTMWNIRFFETDNEFLMYYAKTTSDLSNVVFVIANLDPFHKQSGWVQVPFEEFEIPENQSYLVHDLISNNKYVWYGSRNYVELDPKILPVHIFKVNRKLKRENDFDYYF
ncbi:MAG: alpha-1,4-glucan--maltose-1-phosphate maltosyltransferase [Chitinispirillaceae bacterium]|nr:alpha-1,4-glucan--maltose-1-phosphate maltosyltransferase [Chitinispirillaceae bacterium]